MTAEDVGLSEGGAGSAQTMLDPTAQPGLGPEEAQTVFSFSVQFILPINKPQDMNDKGSSV